MPPVKNVGEPCAREPHARFEVAAGGNQASRRARAAPGASRRPYRGDYSQTGWAHPEIEWVIADGPSPGRWTGLASAAEGIREVLNAWKDFQTVADEYRELDDERVLVLGHLLGRGKTSGLELGQAGAKGAGLLNICSGRVTRFVLYWDRDRALADLGLEG
jgi:hypothetical protein